MDAQTQFVDMGRQCDYCKGKSFRRSKLQGKDWAGLFLLRYPVRCLSCSQRQTVGMKTAMRAVPSSVHQVRHSRRASDMQEVDHTVQKASGPLGGGSFPALRTQRSAAMPDLSGIELEHHAPVQNDADGRRAG